MLEAKNPRSRTRLIGAAVTVALLAAFVTASLPAAHAQSGGGRVRAALTGVDFDSQFTADHTGWTPVLGNWVDTASTYYNTKNGGNVNSIKHAGTYRNFVYVVRAKKIGTSSGRIFFRGTPGTLLGDKSWKSGYIYYWWTDGTDSVDRVNAGSYTTLWSLGPDSALVSGDNQWNVFKIVMYGNYIRLFVNGTMVWSYADGSPIASGLLGLGQYTGSGTNKLVIDYAKAQVIYLDSTMDASAGVQAPRLSTPFDGRLHR